MKSGNLLRKLILWVNALAAVSLLISDLASWIDPNDFLLPSFFGLAFLPILLFNVLFAAFWLIFKFKYALVSSVAILLSWSNISAHINFHWNGEAEAEGITVLSYNVRLFDLYSWTNNKNTRNKLLSYFQGENADIICMQEYFNTNDNNYFNTLDTLLEVQQAQFVHEDFTAIMHGGKHKFGIATLSRFPIIKKGRVAMDTAGHNIAIYTDIKINEDTVRVFNLHLASVHISALEDEISDHIERSEQQKQWDDLKVLVRKLAGGFKRRSLQADVIATYIAESPYPVIICGDLNDTPASYAYTSLSDNLVDCFEEQGNGMGSTYIGYYPSLRIDYLLHSPEITLERFETVNIELSDHRPLKAVFSIGQ